MAWYMQTRKMCMFEAMDSSGNALQLFTQYISAVSRVQSGVCTMAVGWQSRTGREGILLLSISVGCANG